MNIPNCRFCGCGPLDLHVHRTAGLCDYRFSCPVFNCFWEVGLLSRFEDRRYSIEMLLLAVTSLLEHLDTLDAIHTADRYSHIHLHLGPLERLATEA